MKPSKGLIIGYWVATALFTLQMGFTAYAQLTLPQLVEVFSALGYPQYFRVELAWLKVAGLAALVLPFVPARLKEWANAGFVFTLLSAIVAHLAIGEGFAVWSWAAGTLGLWAVQYALWRRLEALKREDPSALREPARALPVAA